MRELTQSAIDAAQSPRIAAAVSGSTVAAGIGERFNLIPWGDVAAILGAVLSFCLIVLHIWRFILDKRRLDLQIRQLEDERAERIRRGGGGD